jgi:hypothetical protein
MISKILDNLTWISIFMIVGGVMMAILGSTGEQIGVDFWGIKVNSSNGGVALAIVGGLLMLKPVMAALKNSSSITTENGLLYLTVIIEDKETARGIANAEILVDFLEGKKTFHTDRDGTAHLSFSPQNKLLLKSTTLSVSAGGYQAITNKKLDLEAGEVKKYKLSKKSNIEILLSEPVFNGSKEEGIRLAIQYLTQSKDQAAVDILKSIFSQFTDSQKVFVSSKIAASESPDNNFNPQTWRNTFISVLKDLKN